MVQEERGRWKSDFKTTMLLEVEEVVNLYGVMTRQLRLGFRGLLTFYIELAFGSTLCILD